MELLILAFRSALYIVDVRSDEEVALFLEDAVMAPMFFFRLLILCPDSSSEEE